MTDRTATAGLPGRRLPPLPRAMVALAAVLLIAASVLPLWSMTMFAPQYQEGLRLHIYPSRLDGGNGGQDVQEINVLNHYIGMRALSNETFPEFRWIPAALAAFAVLLLVAAAIGRVGPVLGVLALYAAFSVFSLWTFASKLYAYGHDLAPDAPVKVDPFMPPMFGYKQMANFEVYSYPAAASYLLAAVPLALVAGLVLTRRRGRIAAPAGGRA